jgi:hypothetical protein
LAKIVTTGLSTELLPALLTPPPQQTQKKRPKQTSVPTIMQIIAGSVRRIQKDKPADTSNWLPAPVGDFNLTMRLYIPEAPILDGSVFAYFTPFAIQ